MTRSAVLTPHGALEPGPMAAILANHAVPGCEVTDPDGRRHTRLLTTPGGPRRVTVTVRPGDVELTADTDDDGEFAHLVTTTRAWLDLDTDTEAIARAFGATDVVAERGEEGVQRVQELTEGIGADAVLECVGTEDARRQAVAVPGRASGQTT